MKYIEFKNNLLKTCKNIKPRWNEHLELWEDDNPGEYIEIAVFAHYIVDGYKESETNDFGLIFNIIEQAIKEGDKEVRRYVITGLLESIRNFASNTEFGEDVFKKWFGPLTLKAWYELEELWSNCNSLADVIRKEKKS